MSVPATNYLEREIDRAVDYARQEFHLTYAEVIGVLMLKANDLADECRRGDEADESEDEEPS